MPHNLANIQPPLTASSLSLVKPGGKGESRSLVRTATGSASAIVPGLDVATPGAGGQSPIRPVLQQLEGNTALLSPVLCVHSRGFNLFKFLLKSALRNAKGNFMPWGRRCSSLESLNYQKQKEKVFSLVLK